MYSTVAKALAASALAAGLLLAACSASSGQHRPPRSSTPAAATSSTPPGHGTEDFPPNVSLATQAAFLPPGPFRITPPLHCGKLTATERRKFGTTARRGFVYGYVNVSRSTTGSPSVAVNFLAGHLLAGSNVTGDQEGVGPGQSGEGEVDAVGLSGQPITFTGCQLTGYSVVTPGGDSVGTYRPVSP